MAKTYTVVRSGYGGGYILTKGSESPLTGVGVDEPNCESFSIYPDGDYYRLVANKGGDEIEITNVNNVSDIQLFPLGKLFCAPRET